jgi:hypothetical protein
MNFMAVEAGAIWPFSSRNVMETESTMRADLSQIHWFKRLTLIVLWFIFGASIAMAVGLQFVWFDATFLSPESLVIVSVDARGLLFLASAETFPSPAWQFDADGGPYSENENRWHRRFINPGFRILPGVCFATGAVSTYVHETTIHINHLWLISLAGALYFIARYRVHRAIRKLSLEPPVSSHV